MSKNLNAKSMGHLAQIKPSPMPDPDAREWVGLTDEERNNLWREERLWLEAIGCCADPSHDEEELMKAIEAILRQKNTSSPMPDPDAREWVGLTDKERNNLWIEIIGWGDPSHDDEDLMKAIEAKLREKNA